MIKFSTMLSPPKLYVGILEAGPNSPDMIQKHGSFGSWFVRFFSQTSSNFSFRIYKSYNGELPPVSEECDAYVVTGSHHSVLDDTSWMRKLQHFLTKTSKKQPVVGICFGHQLLHHALGGTVEQATNGWGIGIHKYSIIKNTEWMDRPKKTLQLCVSHADQVIRTAPHTNLIAESNFCPNAMTTIGKNILTLQAHPEMMVEFAADLYNSRRSQLGENLVDIALQSLKRPTDEQIVSRWVTNFIGDRVKDKVS